MPNEIILQVNSATFVQVLFTDITKLNDFVLNFNNKPILAFQDIHPLYRWGWKNMFLTTEGPHHGYKII